MLVDSFGRTVTDIRISVTKRCNFGCIYCHDEGLGPVARPRSPHADEMTPVEVERLVRVAREFDIHSVKFTGGEPLVRPDLEEIVGRTVRHMDDISLTTNGSMLAARAEALRNAGLKRVNVSIDSLDSTAFQEIRKGALAPVLRGIEQALHVGLKPVKLNMVVFRLTLPHIPEMIRFVSRNEGLRLQLIQFMPELVGPKDWSVDIDGVKRWLESRADKVLVREMHHRRIYQFGGAEVEVVDPVVQRGVLHELPPHPGYSPGRAQRMPQSERRSDPHPRTRGSRAPGRVPIGGGESSSVLWSVRARASGPKRGRRPPAHPI